MLHDRPSIKVVCPPVASPSMGTAPAASAPYVMGKTFVGLGPPLTVTVGFAPSTAGACVAVLPGARMVNESEME